MKLFIFGNKYTERLINEIEIILSNFENSGVYYNSCKQEILPIAKQYVIQRKKEAINIIDYTETAMIIIINLSFDLLSSGRYHIYTKLLNETGRGIYNLYHYCMKWAVRNNKVTQDEFDEQLTLLNKNINFVG